MGVFLGVGREGGALLVGHVTVGQAVGPGHNVNRCYQVDYTDYLSQWRSAEAMETLGFVV